MPEPRSSARLDSAPSAPVESRPGAGLGLWTLTALVVGNMVGSGVFLLPASLARFGAASLVG